MNGSSSDRPYLGLLADGLTAIFVVLLILWNLARPGIVPLAVACVGVLFSLLRIWRDRREHWQRYAAMSCLVTAFGIMSLPSIELSLKAHTVVNTGGPQPSNSHTQQSQVGVDASGEVTIRTGTAPYWSIPFLVAAIVFGTLDELRSRRTRPTPAAASDPAPAQSQTVGGSAMGTQNIYNGTVYHVQPSAAAETGQAPAEMPPKATTETLQEFIRYLRGTNARPDDDDDENSGPPRETESESTQEARQHVEPSPVAANTSETPRHAHDDTHTDWLQGQLTTMEQAFVDLRFENVRVHADAVYGRIDSLQLTNEAKANGLEKLAEAYIRLAKTDSGNVRSHCERARQILDTLKKMK